MKNTQLSIQFPIYVYFPFTIYFSYHFFPNWLSFRDSQSVKHDPEWNISTSTWLVAVYMFFVKHLLDLFLSVLQVCIKLTVVVNSFDRSWDNQELRNVLTLYAVLNHFIVITDAQQMGSSVALNYITGKTKWWHN